MRVVFKCNSSVDHGDDRVNRQLHGPMMIPAVASTITINIIIITTTIISIITYHHHHDAATNAAADVQACPTLQL